MTRQEEALQTLAMIRRERGVVTQPTYRELTPREQEAVQTAALLRREQALRPVAVEVPPEQIYPELGYTIRPYVPGKEPTPIQLRPPTEQELKPISWQLGKGLTTILGPRKEVAALLPETHLRRGQPTTTGLTVGTVASVEAFWRPEVPTLWSAVTPKGRAELKRWEQEFPGYKGGLLLGEIGQAYAFGKAWEKVVVPAWQKYVVPSRVYHAVRYSRPVMALESKVRGTYWKYVGRRLWGYKPPPSLAKYERILRPLTLPPIGRGYEGFYYAPIHYPSILYPSKIYYPTIPQWGLIFSPKGLSVQQILTKYVKFGEAAERYEREVLLRTVKFGKQEIPELAAKIYKPSFIEWSEQYRLFVGLPKKTIPKEISKIVHTPFAFHFPQPIEGMPISDLYQAKGPTLKVIGIPEERLSTWIKQVERQYGRYRTSWVVHFPEITQKRLPMYFAFLPKAVGFPLAQLPKWIKEYERKYGKKRTAWGEPKPVEVQFLEKEITQFRPSPRQVPLFPPKEIGISKVVSKVAPTPSQILKRIEKITGAAVPGLVKYKGPSYPFVKMREWGKPKLAAYPSARVKKRRKRKEVIGLRLKGVSEQELKKLDKQIEKIAQLPSQLERQLVGPKQALKLKQIQKAAVPKIFKPPPQKLGRIPPTIPPTWKWPRRYEPSRRRGLLGSLFGRWYERKHPIATEKQLMDLLFGKKKQKRKRKRRKRRKK